MIKGYYYACYCILPPGAIGTAGAAVSKSLNVCSNGIVTEDSSDFLLITFAPGVTYTSTETEYSSEIKICTILLIVN